MIKFYQFIIWFIFMFLLIYTYRLIFVVKGSSFNKNKIPVDVQYMSTRFKIDLSKINYRKFIKMTSFVTAFDMAFTYSILVCFIKNIYLCLLIGVVILIPLIIISFNVAGKYWIRHYK